MFGIITCCIVAFGMALIAVATKGLNGVDVSLIQFYYGVVSCGMIGGYLLVFSIATGTIPFSGCTWSTWIELFITAIINLIAMASMTLCN